MNGGYVAVFLPIAIVFVASLFSCVAPLSLRPMNDRFPLSSLLFHKRISV